MYLRWPERDLLALSPLVRLLWGALIDELITSFDAKQGIGCQPVLLLIDEAGRTAIPSLADHATTVVGRGITLWLAVQSLSQLETVYGKARAQVLRDNMESQIYYRPTDLATAKYLGSAARGHLRLCPLDNCKGRRRNERGTGRATYSFADRPGYFTTHRYRNYRLSPPSATLPAHPDGLANPATACAAANSASPTACETPGAFGFADRKHGKI